MYITLFLSALCTNLFAQSGKKLNANEKAAFEQKMTAHLKGIKTLQCSFVQEKTSLVVAGKSVSSGIMLYRSPNMLRWEYTKPTISTLIVNNGNTALFNKDGKQIGNNAMVKQLGNIIIGLISGAGIQNNKQFTTEIFETDTQFRLVLTPVPKRLQEYCKSIEMIVDKRTLLSHTIVMNETSGDTMSIYMNTIVLNKEIAQSKFAISE
jgi:outer membrane lipoprotein-sorting protein